MGRADLSRHRLSSLSDTPPVPFPDQLNWIYSELSKYEESSVKKAIASFHNASTQRDQVQAVKLLGIALRDSHIVDEQKQKPNRPNLACLCIHGTQRELEYLRPLCMLVSQLLAALLFDTPSATGGLSGSALRAFLLCRSASVPCFESPVTDFLERLGSWASRVTLFHDLDDTSTDYYSWFQQAANDVCALATILSEKRARTWILEKPTYVISSLHLISLVPKVYCRVFREVKSHARESASLEGKPLVSKEFNLSVIEGACDSSVKAAQDIIAFITKSQGDANSTFRNLELDSLDLVVQSCSSLLQLATAPRSTAMACAVAYISGMLLRHSKDPSPAAFARVLQEYVIKPAMHLPPFSQLSLYRAVMEAPAARCTLPFVLYPPEEERFIEMDPTKYLFDLLASLTNNSKDVHLRFLAMDALVACVRRRHPEKLNTHCRDIVLRLVSERIQEPIPRISAQIREAMEALMMVDGNDEESTSFWFNKARVLLKGDWLFKGIYAPLGVLVGRLGACRLLEAEPKCQSLAMHAASVDARLAKSVSDWLLSFWRALRAEGRRDHKIFNEITLDPLAQALVHRDNSNLRERVAEYIIPAFFRSVERHEIEDCAQRLLRKVEEITAPGSVLRMRGNIAVMSSARTFGVFIASFSNPKVCDLVGDALCSSSEDIRSAALDLVATSRVPTEPISSEELDLLCSHLPVALMPGSSPGYHSRFRHSMRRFFDRLATCRHAALDGSGGWWMRERKLKYNGIRTQAFEESRLRLLERIENFEKQCSHFLISSAYPGAPFVRRTNALELGKLLSVNLSFQTAFNSKIPSAHSYVSGIMGCLLDEWERPRRAAVHVMASLQDPVPCFESSTNITELQLFAWPLLFSPRQRDVDSGASIFRCIFQKYILKTTEVSMETSNPLILFCGKQNLRKAEILDTCTIPGLIYAESVLDSLERSVNEAETDFIESCKRGLFHGHCLLLRYIVQDLPWRTLSSSSNIIYSRRFLKHFISLYQRCTNIAMRGVSFQAVEDDFKTVRNGDGSDVEYSDHLQDLENILLGTAKQVVSTSCFLSMKEMCVSLGILCHVIPIDGDTSLDTHTNSIITLQELRSISDMFLFIFTSTRHWGVIDGASEGLQLLCEKLLQASGNSMRALPEEWIARILDMTLNGNLYVLRRSAGIPHLISAVVNAEAAIIKRSYDNPLLDKVMTALLLHLEKTHMFTEDSLLKERRSRREESVVHALNLLRSLFLNGNIATSILNYLEAAMMHCITAFCSASWLIRNSALMLFSALVRRGVGVCLERKPKKSLSSFEVAGGTSATLEGDRRLSGVTALQFFARYPKLHPFLFKQLVSAIAQYDRERREDHPVLFPTLYLLSSLAPSAIEDPTSAQSMASFRQLLRKCLHWRSNYVRRAAAAACVPLMQDPCHVAELIEEHLTSSVPIRPQAVSVAVGKRDDTVASTTEEDLHLNGNGTERLLIQNHLHGDLLAILAILNGASRMMSSGNKAELLKRMAKRLPQRVWVAKHGTENTCSVTRAAMISVLEKIYDIARELDKMDGQCEESKRSCQDIFEICKDVSFSLHRSDFEAPTTGSEVGISGFRACAARFVVGVTVSCYERGEILFDEGLQRLKWLVYCEYREGLQEGLGGVRRICQFGKEDDGDGDGLATRKVPAATVERLMELWSRGCDVIFSGEYQDVVVAALRLLTALSRQLHGYFKESQGVRQLVHNETGTSLLDIVEGHNCVDIREGGIILAGHVMATGVPSQEFCHRWITVVENMASLQLPPTSRIASCLSFDQSGLGQHCWSEKDRFLREIAVRGLLSVAGSVEDDSDEVRSTALKVVQRCIGGSATGTRDSEDTLPALMCLFDKLTVRFCKTSALFRHMQGLLSNVDLGEEDILMTKLQDVLGIKCENGVEDNFVDTKHKIDSGSADLRHEKSRLFELEEDTEGGEIILRSQLVCWSYRKAILRGQIEARSYESLCKVCTILNERVHSAVKSGIRKTGRGIISGEVFTVEGFTQCYMSILRLFLGMSCLQCNRFEGNSIVEETVERIGLSLGELNEKLGGDLHPTLCCAIDGMRRILMKDEDEGSLQNVLFLLRV